MRIWIVDILYVYPKEKISSAVGFEPGLSALSDILYSNNLTTLTDCMCLCGYIPVQDGPVCCSAIHDRGINRHIDNADVSQTDILSFKHKTLQNYLSSCRFKSATGGGSAKPSKVCVIWLDNAFYLIIFCFD